VAREANFAVVVLLLLTDYIKISSYKNLNFHSENYTHILCMYVERERYIFLRGSERTKKCAVCFEKSSLKVS